MPAVANYFALVGKACARASIGHNRYSQYVNDPVAFTREVLGFEPWEGQRRVLEALAAGNSVCNPAGRAVGKSRLDAAAALWFAFTRPGSRVILTAPVFKQVQETLWEEIRRVLYGILDNPLPCEFAKRATTGLRTDEGSQIIGITAENPGAFQGIRAADLLVIVDEASEVPDEIFNVLEGNMAGGAKLLLTGNPTRPRGYFREAMRNPRFTTIKIASTDSPNYVNGTSVVPGLATRAWVDERKAAWGEDSALYKIHVLGEVVEAEEGKLFPMQLIAGAELAWHETIATGRLIIGLDPAGESGEGDESAFACRRGNKVLKVYGRRGLTAEAHVIELLGLIATFKGESAETPIVIMDRDGHVGAKVYAEIAAYQYQHETVFTLIGIRNGERAKRNHLIYDKVRDEVWFGLHDAFKQGLAIPTDLILERDLSEIQAETQVSGRSKVTSKEDLRKAMGRSPDRGDALCLCVVHISDWVAPAATQTNQLDPYIEPRTRGIDPYAGAINSAGSIDPYGNM